MENTIIHPDGPPRFGCSWSELTTVQNYFKLVIEQGKNLQDFGLTIFHSLTVRCRNSSTSRQAMAAPTPHVSVMNRIQRPLAISGAM